MSFTKKLKRTKDMTDSDLLAEFRLAQKIARNQGQHLPLTVTRHEPETPGIMTPIHRPTVERDLDIFRRELERNGDVFNTFGGQMPSSSHKKETPKRPQRMAQNKGAQNVGKSLNKPRRFLGPLKYIWETLEAGLDIIDMASQRNFDIARELGQQGAPRERLIKTFKENLTPEIERAYQEGLNEANQRNR